MDAATIFSITNSLALLAWVGLIAVPHFRWTQPLIRYVVITIFALCYAFLLFGGINMQMFQEFSTLAGVMRLFQSETAVLAGWLHYLAFDLMVGMYIANDAKTHQIKHVFIIPSLLLTFMLGPFGLLTYYLIKGGKRLMK